MKISHTASSHIFTGAFTLAETMLSATIASTALITALSLMTSGISATKESHREVAAVLLATRVAGVIQSQADVKDASMHVEVYDSALHPVTSDGGAAWGASDYDSGVRPFKADYLVSWQLTPPAASEPQVAKVKITVEAPASVVRKNRRSYTYATLVQR